MKKLYFFIGLLFFVIFNYASTEKILIDYFDRPYVFEKDPNTVLTLNRIDKIETFEFEDGNECMIIYEKFDIKGKGYQKEICTTQNSLGNLCTSILIIEKQAFDNGQVQSNFKHMKTIDGVKSWIRYTKLHKEFLNFKSNLPSIKTE